MMELNCEYVRDAYPDHLTGRLDAGMMQEVRAHLLSCEACAREAEILDAVSSEQIVAPENLHASILAAAALPEPRPKSGRAALVMAASIAVAVIGGIALLRSGEQRMAPAPESAGFGYVSVEQAMLSGKASLDDFSEEQLQTLLEEMET